MKNVARTPTIVALVGAILGLVFSGYSTSDYMEHLDRQLHAVHCSFIPGMAASSDAESPCRAAMYSAYSALMRESWWGGIPISLFALGVYAFFIAMCLALLVGGLRCSRRAFNFFAVASLGPLGASIVMALISATKLGSFCRTCVGMYVASILLTLGGVWAMREVRKACVLLGAGANPTVQPDQASDAVGSTAMPPPGRNALLGVWLMLMGVAVLTPSLVYVSSLPDYRPKLAACGKLAEPADSAKSLVKLPTLHPKRSATLFVDPLCPSCKALHERFSAEGVTENLDLSLALFPLDSTCNWMVDRALHPGACLLSRAVLCAEPRSRDALEWMYANQELLTELGKSGEPLLHAKVRERFGADLDACVDAKATKIRLNNVLQYAVSNHVPVSTPQLYLGEQRICDEDTDLGLRYTLGQLAPEVLR